MSRFLPGGTVDAPIERDEAWLKAEREIEAKRKATQDARRQDEGKSLYDTLQANKAAKQEAFEESIKLRNQFRSLDEDEIGFLDSVLESTRAKEEAVRRETSLELDRFRREREQRDNDAKLAEAQAGAAGVIPGSLALDDSGLVPDWTVSGRKRKRRGSKVQRGAGVKLRRASSAAVDTHVDEKGPEPEGDEAPSAPLAGVTATEPETKLSETTMSSEPPVAKTDMPGLGLEGYPSSDED